MKTKILPLFMIIVTILFSLTGCYDAHGIEDFAYATAIGIDISEDNFLLLTLQFSNPPSNSESSSKDSNKTTNITVKCNSINSGISLIDSYINKEINLSHCKVIVISEELAYQGISEYIDTLANSIEVRPDCNLIISKCSAENFINNAKPLVETLTARYYEVTVRSSEYTGFTTSTKLVDFIGDLQSEFKQASAILGGLSQSSNYSNTSNQENSNNKSDNSYVAGETPISDSPRIETFGTAVFHNSKLVGELNGIETICHLISTNDLRSCTISIPNISTINSNIDLQIKQRKNTKINVDFINNTPYITLNVYLEGYGLSLDENIDYSSEEDIKALNLYAEEYMKAQLENYLYKTSKTFNSDIAGFGKYTLSHYLTWDEWLTSNWLENYKNSFFNVNVDVNIKSGYQFNKSP